MEGYQGEGYMVIDMFKFIAEEQNEMQRKLDEPQYEHIERNIYSYREHEKQNEEDIAICICQYDASNPDSACSDQCLNVLTNTECTPGHCPCEHHCMNEKSQKREYAKVKLFQTEGRGWGLLADEDIRAGQFIIEYCGEVISSNEAKQRVEAYEAEGLKESYIIVLDGQELIDATRKGSLARFINHSCEPNCETRKWTVLGEVRVGIFAKQDIPLGTELSYDYNFEWFAGAKVRCVRGATSCSEYLGAKSRGFMAADFDWEENSDSFSAEDISLSYSNIEEPTLEYLPTYDTAITGEYEICQNSLVGSQNNHIQISSMLHSSGSSKKSARKNGRKKLSAAEISERLWSKVAREEVLACEASMNEAKLKFDSISQEMATDGENVPMDVAGSWLDAHCKKMATEFDFFSSIIKNVIKNVEKPKDDAMSSGDAGDGVRFSKNDV